MPGWVVFDPKSHTNAKRGNVMRNYNRTQQETKQDKSKFAIKLNNH